MEELKITVTMTKAQAKELERYADNLRENYESGFYDFDIKRCFRDHTRSYLFEAVLCGAFGWFSSHNVPFACVYGLVEAFVNETLKIYGL